MKTVIKAKTLIIILSALILSACTIESYTLTKYETWCATKGGIYKINAGAFPYVICNNGQLGTK